MSSRWIIFLYRNWILEWAKCGDNYLSTVPTLIWALGAAAFANRLLNAMFRRFLFRRVPLWEQILQHLLFVWMMLYSLHFWHVIVRILKVFVEYHENKGNLSQGEDMAGINFVQQWLIWLCSFMPLAIFVYTKQRTPDPPLMIWITTNPWQRREMGPYGYYLNRPFSSTQSFNEMTQQERSLTQRRASSDSKIAIKEMPKKRRCSKSV